MPTNNQVKVAICVVLVIWIIVGVAMGQPSPAHLLTSFSYAISASSIVWLLWERWLWACPIFRSWLTTRPDLRGTWKGELLSSWTNPQTAIRSGAVEAYLVIRQTFTSIDARLFSLESDSVSLSANIVSDASNIHTLFVTYRNEPKALLREKSPIHYGGMVLHVRGLPVQQLDGGYWTERFTKGNAIFLNRVSATGHDFNNAAGLFVSGQMYSG
jgi:hypothetical protein